jgi:hypothetical protein
MQIKRPNLDNCVLIKIPEGYVRLRIRPSKDINDVYPFMDWLILNIHKMEEGSILTLPMKEELGEIEIYETGVPLVVLEGFDKKLRNVLPKIKALDKEVADILEQLFIRGDS